MSVTYIYISEDGPDYDVVYNSQPCFSSLNHQPARPHCIRYIAKINQDKAPSDFWIAFIAEWLDEDMFAVIPSDDESRVEFWLNCKDMTLKQTLLYLTAFRYVEEFHECCAKMLRMWRTTQGSPEHLFIELCIMHSKGEEYGYGSGHALASQYSSYIPGYLTITEFRERMIDDSILYVHQFFKKSNTPEPVFDKTDPCF